MKWEEYVIEYEDSKAEMETQFVKLIGLFNAILLIKNTDLNTKSMIQLNARQNQYKQELERYGGKYYQF